MPSTPTARRPSLRRRLTRAWLRIVVPLLRRFLRKCRERYRRRLRLERLDDEVALIALDGDDTIWSMRRWTQITHWRVLRHGASSIHAIQAA